MKLIVSHLESLRTYVSREFYYVMSELISTYGWKQIEIGNLWNGSESLRAKLLERYGELPETILFWEAYEFLQAHVTAVDHLDCHKVFFADDLHWRDEQVRKMKMMCFARCDTIFATGANVWADFYPEFCTTKEIIWVPHSASPDFTIGYNEEPENSIFLSGAMTHHYPLRLQMKKLHEQGSHSIAYHGHPGYCCGYDYDENKNIGRGYAERINRYRAGFTDSLIYGYVIAKYFEIPATGALLFADDAVSEPLKELGFIPDKHYLPVSKEDLEEKVRYVLDDKNHEAVDEIRRRGQQLVWEKHKTSDRARQMNEAVSQPV